MLRQLMRSRIHSALTRFANGDAACWRTTSAHMGVRALLVIVGTRLQDELLEKTEAYRTFRHPKAPGRPSLGAECGNPVAERERLLSLQIPPRNLDRLARFDRARLPRCWFSCNFFACRRIM